MLRRNVTALLGLAAILAAGCSPEANVASSGHIKTSPKEQAYFQRLQAEIPEPVTVRLYADGMITWQGMTVSPQQLDYLFVRVSATPGMHVRVTPKGADPRRVAAVIALARSHHVVAGLYDGA